MDLMLVIFIASLLIVLLGAIFKKMQDIFLTEPLLSMVAGIILGPMMLKVFDYQVSEKFKILELIAEFTMAMALMATALRVPGKFIKKSLKSQSVLVVGGMILMWILSSGIVYLLFKLTIAECLLIGAVITPTDPVLSSTIVSGNKAEKNLSPEVRNSLSFESGINDGLAYPIVFLAIYLLMNSKFPVEKWVTGTILYETLLCAVMAFAVGFTAGYLMEKAHMAGWMTNKSILPFSLALSLLLLSGFNLLNMNGIIAVFVGGLAFARAISKNDDIREENVQESMERLTLIPVFFIFGIFLPWNDWFSLGWVAITFVIFILLFRRIPAILLLTPFLKIFKGKLADIMMVGWFGPVGVAAIYYSILSREKTLIEEVWVLPSLIVFASTVVHGLSSLPLGKVYRDYKDRKNI